MAVTTRASNNRQIAPKPPSRTAPPQCTTNPNTNTNTNKNTPTTNAKRKQPNTTEPEPEPASRSPPTKAARRQRNTATVSSGAVDVVDLTGDQPASSPVRQRPGSRTTGTNAPLPGPVLGPGPGPSEKRPGSWTTRFNGPPLFPVPGAGPGPSKGRPKSRTTKDKAPLGPDPGAGAGAGAGPSEEKPKPEKRARVFRSRPPASFLDRKYRATTQRMFVVGNTVREVDGAPEMSFDIVGSTGNIYKTVIGRMPYCNCPDSEKGNQCKHICYVLINALKAPNDLQYQLAFLTNELHQIYEGSPLNRKDPEPQTENTEGNRKPIDGECPICFMEFEPDKEDIVWCRAQCGNNIHKMCFQRWADTQRGRGVTCVYCRSEWEFEKGAEVDVRRLMSGGSVNEEGYVNVARQLGISELRDYSTYSPWSNFGSYSSRRRMWY